MVATVIHNGTTSPLYLKEGNAGVYRDIEMLPSDKMHIIEIDPNATYREYVVVDSPGGQKVFVTSDDCVDNSKITIVLRDNKYTFVGEARGSRPDPKAPESGTAKSGAPGFLSKFKFLDRLWSQKG